MLWHKEYTERRLIGPDKLIFWPEMGLLGSQASTKKISYEL